jgi:aryl-alcohol dehydrogenase-like predicted oxidoreductase
MEKTRLGRTNLLVTRLGWGGIPIQRVGEAEGVAVIRALVEMGVDLLDTARGYTNSEHRVGLALKNTDRPVILSTKSAVRTEKIYKDVQTSLKEMEVKKISIYHLHAVNHFQDYEKVMETGGAYLGLKRARDEGLIDYIGITSHNLKVLERAIEDGYFDVIMACYSFLEPDAAEKVFPLAKARNIGILAMKPLSGGVIGEAGPALRFVLSHLGSFPFPGQRAWKSKENWGIFTKVILLLRKIKNILRS